MKTVFRFFSIALLIAIGCLPAAAAEGSFDRTLNVTGPVRLDVSTGSGSIQIHIGSGNQVRVTGRIKSTDWFGNSEERIKEIEANPPVQQSGNDIRIGHLEDREMMHNISISYELVIPAETELRSHTGSGSQTIAGVHGTTEVSSGSGSLHISDIGSRLKAETGSGDIDIDRIQGSVRARAGSGSIRATSVAGGFDAETGSGRISLEQSAPGSVRVDTGSGGMQLRGVKGSLEARAGSGGIEVEGEPTGPWTVHTGSGTVRLQLASNASFDLDARTSSGSLSVDQPVTVQGSLAKKHIQGKVRGGGVPVDVETGSGNIEIR
ncbi:MAG TPA: DUF4097 family beta strand repeat-containing protein [Nitrospira sp.]|nr:DUF4097 family beta strand repeat-containing protein [Nitrospira sp.]